MTTENSTGSNNALPHNPQSENSKREDSTPAPVSGNTAIRPDTPEAIKQMFEQADMSQEEDVPFDLEDENEEEDYEDYCEPEDDSLADYGRSGEKYGWYNGFSDDVIDDAFEGDPEATWNVD